MKQSNVNISMHAEGPAHYTIFTFHIGQKKDLLKINHSPTSNEVPPHYSYPVDIQPIPKQFIEKVKEFLGTRESVRELGHIQYNHDTYGKEKVAVPVSYFPKIKAGEGQLKGLPYMMEYMAARYLKRHKQPTHFQSDQEDTSIERQNALRRIGLKPREKMKYSTYLRGLARGIRGNIEKIESEANDKKADKK